MNLWTASAVGEGRWLVWLLYHRRCMHWQATAPSLPAADQQAAVPSLRRARVQNAIGRDWTAP
jgi:hypothetical protein